MSPLESGFNLAFLFGILTASLAGSSHCIGMCGGLVLTATHTNSATGHKLIINQISYHGARLVSYLIIGSLAGLVGQSLLNHQISLYLSIVATTSVALLFIYTGIQVARGEQLKGPFDKYFSRISIKLFPKINHLESFMRPLVTGLATGLLPCAWLYSFVLMSLSTKSPFQGALVLAVFWLGTVPALSFGTLVLQKILLSLNVKVSRLVGAMLVLIGLWTLYGRASHIYLNSAGEFKESSQGGHSCHE